MLPVVFEVFFFLFTILINWQRVNFSKNLESLEPLQAPDFPEKQYQYPELDIVIFQNLD